MRLLNYLMVLLTCFNLYASDVNDLYEKAEQSILKSFRDINTHWCYPSDDWSRPLSTSSFSVKEIQTSRGLTHALIWNPEVQPHLGLALEEALTTPLESDCMNASRLVRIKVAYDLMGDKAFHQLVENYSKTYEGFDLLQVLSWHFFEASLTLDENAIYAYPFVNLPNYLIFKPTGASGNHNIFCLRGHKYVGFEPSLFGEPLSKADLERFMYEEFKNPQDVTPSLQLEHKRYCSILTFNIFKHMREKNQPGYYKLNMNKIRQETAKFS